MHADLVLFNGDFHTMDPDQPTASAVAIRDGRFVAVGDDAAMKALLAPDGESVDLNGQTVTPGFIDAHLHFLSYGLSLREIDLISTPTLESALERVQARATETPAGQWLTGRGWDQTVWADGAFPSKEDLERVTTEHPVFLRRKCGHVGWANAPALALAGITPETSNPDGGEIERDANGQPTGILKETAMQPFFQLLGDPSDEEAIDAVRLAMETVHGMGIVGVHNLEGAAALRAMQHLRANGELKLRVMAGIPESELDDAIALGIQSGYGDEWLRFGAVKVFSDGALGARTAWMIDPYEGEPDNRGIAVATAEHMNAVVEKASRAGLAVFTHAIGDMANRVVLDAIERTRNMGIGLHLRHRIEHAQVLHPDDLNRFVALDVIPSMQPIHCTADMLIADKNWGDRVRYSYAWQSLWQTGAKLCFGSDAPVETPDVIQGLHAAVTRTRADGTPGGEGWVPEEKLSVDQAVWAYTAGAAYASGEEAIKGTITPGKLADLTILSQNIFDINPSALLETDILGTVVGGEFVFRDGV